MSDLKNKLDLIVNQFIQDMAQENKDVELWGGGVLYEKICSELKNLVNQKLKLKNVAIYGNGEMTRKFFGAVGNVPDNIVCIIDKMFHEPLFWKLEKIPVIRPEKISEFSLDTILIPSKALEKEIKDELMEQGFRGEVIGIHSWLIRRGYNLTEEFHRYNDLWKYRQINKDYVQFIQTEEPMHLLKVIIGLLFIRDYGHALVMIEQYLKFGWTASVRLAKLKLDIETVFVELRKELEKRKTRNVMLFLVDSLNCEAVKNMPHLKEIEAESFSFHNVMDQYGQSRETVMSLMTGYEIFNNQLYERVYFTNDDGELLPYLHKNQFKFQFLAEQRSYAYALIDESSKECSSILAPEVFFEGLCEMCATHGNTFTYMHGLAEIHSPFLNPLYDKHLREVPCDWTLEELRDQYCSSQRYIDEIVWFYYKLLKCDGITQIIMGDHGVVLDSFLNNNTKEYRWNRKQLNPACIISDAYLGVGSNHNLVANYHLAKIFKDIIERSVKKERLEEYADNYVKLAILPVYNPGILKRLVERRQLYKTLGVAGILTDTDIFLHMENGEEKLYVENEEVNPNHILYSDKVKLYRELLAADINELQKVLTMERYRYHNECLSCCR